MVEKGHFLRVLMEKPNGRRQLGRPKQRLDNKVNISQNNMFEGRGLN
jgi:hypothetical protein